MNWWIDAGRFLILAGSVLVVLGFVFLVADKIPLGRLPGDIQIGSGRFHIYIPLVTCILLSIVITIVINFFARK